ncbi:MAG: hypothetical protein LBK56_10885 [Gracilibacteraceae bacterium]|nr:hypothetical protein [Gracilibacteraceae bacterium]
MEALQGKKPVVLLIMIIIMSSVMMVSAGYAQGKIVVDWDDLTYEQIRGFEEIPLATNGEVTLVFSDLLYVYNPLPNSRNSADFAAEAKDRSAIPGAAQSIYDEASLRSAIEFASLLGNLWPYAYNNGWDGVPNDTAREVAAWSIEGIDRELAALSADPETAARLYTAKYLMTAEYHKKWLLRDTGAYYFLMEKDVIPEGLLSDYYSDIAANGGSLALGITGAINATLEDTCLEDMYLHLREGNSLITYAPSFDYTIHVQPVFSFTFYPDDELHYSWIQTAEEGDFRYYPEEDQLFQAIGADEKLLKYHFNLADTPLTKWMANAEGDPWVLNEDVIKSIVNNQGDGPLDDVVQFLDNIQNIWNYFATQILIPVSAVILIIGLGLYAKTKMADDGSRAPREPSHSGVYEAPGVNQQSGHPLGAVQSVIGGRLGYAVLGLVLAGFALYILYSIYVSYKGVDVADPFGGRVPQADVMDSFGGRTPQAVLGFTAFMTYLVVYGLWLISVATCRIKLRRTGFEISSILSKKTFNYRDVDIHIRSRVMRKHDRGDDLPVLEMKKKSQDTHWVLWECRVLFTDRKPLVLKSTRYPGLLGMLALIIALYGEKGAPVS